MSTLFMILIATVSTASAFDVRRFLQLEEPAAPFDLSANLLGANQQAPTTTTESESEGANGAIIGAVVTLLLLFCCCGLCCVGGACWYMKKNQKEKEEVVKSMGIPYGGNMPRPSHNYSDNQSHASTGNMSYD